MSAVIASAPGKINLALLVGPPLVDGYHPLSSVFEAVSLREYVVAEHVPRSGGGLASSAGSIKVTTLLYSQDSQSGNLVFDPRATEDFSKFDGPDHLAVRAAALLAGEDGDNLSLTVHKTLPVAGGMAGGSADAAATLVAMNQLRGLGHTNAQLATLGATLGADVPACVVGGLALGLGRGDQMEQLAPGSRAPGGDSRWWVVAVATAGLSTPHVFRAFDEKLSGSQGTLSVSQGTLGSSESGSSAEFTHGGSIPGVAMDAALLTGLRQVGTRVGRWLVNDLESTVFEMRPELMEVGGAMMEAGAGAWMLSGSGPTIVGLGSTEEEARGIAAKVQRLPQVGATAVVWGPSGAAQVEGSLPVWANA